MISRTLSIVALAVAMLLPANLWAAGGPEKPKNIDVVICLDVSGSMNGLVDSAKIKLWDIVNELAKAKPTPNLRVSLYSYGHSRYDRNAGFVRKDVDLTNDLDEIYKKLNALTINGGSELVTRVSTDAISQQKWSDDKDALKIIFVCGNEPADQDKSITLKDAADKAKDKGIIINTIYCGNADNGEAKGWRDLAALAGGRYATIDQNRGTVAIATPMDKELAELSSKMSTTYVAYGKEGKDRADNQKAQDSNAVKNSAGAAASRATSKSGGLYRNDSWDMVDRMNNDPKFDIKKVPDAELCEEMKKMTPEEREKHVKDLAAKRAEMQKQIADLSAKRNSYIKEEMKKKGDKGDQAFDEAVKGAIREQAKTKGIEIPEKE